MPRLPIHPPGATVPPKSLTQSLFLQGAILDKDLKLSPGHRYVLTVQVIQPRDQSGKEVVELLECPTREKMINCYAAAHRMEEKRPRKPRCRAAEPSGHCGDCVSSCMVPTPWLAGCFPGSS